MEKHKYTPVRLNEAERLCLKSFKQRSEFIKIDIEEIPDYRLDAYRQLHRLGLIDKRRQVFIGHCYVISETGVKYLHRARIQIKLRKLPGYSDQFRLAIYQIIQGTIIPPKGCVYNCLKNQQLYSADITY